MNASSTYADVKKYSVLLQPQWLNRKISHRNNDFHHGVETNATYSLTDPSREWFWIFPSG